MKSYLAKLQGSEFKIQRLSDAPIAQSPICSSPDILATYLREQVKACPQFNADVESLIVVCFNSRRKIIGWQVVSTGTLDCILVHAREVFKAAIILNAGSIALCHNHPSGDSTPSDADIRCTRDIAAAGKLLRIDLVDHIILGTPSESNLRGFCSLREMGIVAPV